MVEEIWKSVSEVKDVLGLELDESKDYQVSNLGGFRVVDSEGNIEDGHITISESQASVSVGKKQVLFHRLLALLFLENDDPSTKTVVIYKDGDHTHNEVSNLAWVSVSERNERRYINQTSTQNVRCIDDNKVFASVTSAALYYAIPVDIIKDAIQRNVVCFGHSFEYFEGSSNKVALYLSTRKAKSLSSMLEDMSQLRDYFEEVHIS